MVRPTERIDLSISRWKLTPYLSWWSNAATILKTFSSSCRSFIRITVFQIAKLAQLLQVSYTITEPPSNCCIRCSDKFSVKWWCSSGALDVFFLFQEEFLLTYMFWEQWSYNRRPLLLDICRKLYQSQ